MYNVGDVSGISGMVLEEQCSMKQSPIEAAYCICSASEKNHLTHVYIFSRKSDQIHVTCRISCQAWRQRHPGQHEPGIHHAFTGTGTIALGCAAQAVINVEFLRQNLMFSAILAMAGWGEYPPPVHSRCSKISEDPHWSSRWCALTIAFRYPV